MMRRSTALLTAGLCVLSSLGVSAAVGATSEPPDSPPESSEPGGSEPDGSAPDELATEPAEAPGVNVTPDDTEPTESTEPAGSTVVTEPELPDWEPQPIQWTPSPDWDGAEEGWLEVPIDYVNPDAGSFQLYVTRHLAQNQAERIGSLLVNPGGPGVPGSSFALAAPQIFNEGLVEHFDIVAWDPRGTGESTPYIDCIDDYDEYFASPDVTPDDDAEREQLVALAEDLADQCVQENAAILPFVGTNNSARDIDSIRRALGEDEISYFGFSYGSELGATWATLFPETVRAAVLDGASDPDADLLTRLLQQNAGFEGALTAYLAECSGDPQCAFHNDGDAEGAFDQLMLKLDAKPIPSEPGRPAVNLSVALQGVRFALYGYTEDSWDQLSSALAAAQLGDGAGLLVLMDSYYGRLPDGTWDNVQEAFQTIWCMDRADRPTVEEEDADIVLLTDVAPRLIPPDSTGGYFCTFFPESIDPRVEITGEGAGPIVVCGATGDPATPLDSTINMANALEDGRLVVIDYDGHLCYGNDPCADEIIDAYLIDLVVPPEQTLCPGVEESDVD